MLYKLVGWQLPELANNRQIMPHRSQMADNTSLELLPLVTGSNDSHLLHLLCDGQLMLDPVQIIPNALPLHDQSQLIQLVDGASCLQSLNPVPDLLLELLGPLDLERDTVELVDEFLAAGDVRWLRTKHVAEAVDARPLADHLGRRHRGAIGLRSALSSVANMLQIDV